MVTSSCPGAFRIGHAGGVPLHGLGEEDDELELGVLNVVGDVGGQVSRSPDGFPGQSRLVQAEVLEAELHGDGAGQPSGVCSRQSRSTGLRLPCRTKLRRQN